MARTYSIASITQSGGVGSPGSVTLTAPAGNVIDSFQGQFYLDSLGDVLPAYTSPAPAGYTLIQATTFQISGNASYNGMYTVYTPVSISDTNASSSFSGGQTSINVIEVIGAPLTPGDATNTGTVSNISTYLITIEGEAPLIIPPTVSYDNRPISVTGRNGAPWGEPLTQNLVDLVQNFANSSPPTAAFLGQLWYNDATNELNLYSTAGWVAIAAGVAGSSVTYRYTQSVAASTWTIVHDLNLPPPFVGLFQVFVNTGSTYKMIIPNDITFQDANTIVVTFTNPQTGVALLRS